MGWWNQPLATTGSIANAVFSRMGLDPAQALAQEKAAVAEAIQQGLERIWTHYAWDEVLDTETYYPANGLVSIGTNDNVLEIEGIYTKDPDVNPTISSLKFNQVRRKVHLLETAPATIIARYWPIPPSIEASYFSPDTSTYTGEGLIDNSEGANGYGVPKIFYSYLVSRAYQEMLIGDGQHDKAGLIAGEAEQILYQKQQEADRRKMGINA